uniref:Uncharacterized protein n=1 Tax=Microcebus murinus TaxID=30608 RepID=A0A8C5XWT9_MICMU
MLGVSRGRARSGGVAGSPARARGSNLWSHRDCFLTSQDGFWALLLPQTLTATWTPGSSPLPPPPRLPYLRSEVWGPVAVGREEAAGSSPPAG